MGLQVNSKLASEVATVTVPTDYAGMATDAIRVQYLIDLIGAESADGTDLLARQYLDEISPIARVTLVAHLTKLKAGLSAEP